MHHSEKPLDICMAHPPHPLNVPTFRGHSKDCQGAATLFIVQCYQHLATRDAVLGWHARRCTLHSGVSCSPDLQNPCDTMLTKLYRCTLVLKSSGCHSSSHLSNLLITKLFEGRHLRGFCTYTVLCVCDTPARHCINNCQSVALDLSQMVACQMACLMSRSASRDSLAAS